MECPHCKTPLDFELWDIIVDPLNNSIRYGKSYVRLSMTLFRVFTHIFMSYDFKSRTPIPVLASDIVEELPRGDTPSSVTTAINRINNILQKGKIPTRLRFLPSEGYYAIKLHKKGIER